jgi:hypothetical protein
MGEVAGREDAVPMDKTVDQWQAEVDRLRTQLQAFKDVARLVCREFTADGKLCCSDDYIASRVNLLRILITRTEAEP